MDTTGVACVIRTYNNNPGSVDTVRRAIEAGVGLVIVVVNASDESTRGNVRTWLSEDEVCNREESRISVIEMTSGYHWSPALNTGLSLLRVINNARTTTGQRVYEYVVNISNEVLWKKEHLQELVAIANADPKIGVVGMNFKGMPGNTSVELGKTYTHPRNTGMLIRTSAFAQIGGFDPICDSYGGQEDFDFLLRMRLFTKLKWAMLQSQVPLLLGKYYDQDEKEERELSAANKNIERYRALFSGDPALSQLLEQTLKQFGFLSAT